MPQQEMQEPLLGSAAPRDIKGKAPVSLQRSRLRRPFPHQQARGRHSYSSMASVVDPPHGLAVRPGYQKMPGHNFCGKTVGRFLEGGTRWVPSAGESPLGGGGVGDSGGRLKVGYPVLIYDDLAGEKILKNFC